MKFSGRSKILITLLFAVIALIENYWFLTHSGPVRWISDYSIHHFGFWSSMLTYGIPIILGILVLLLGIWIIHREATAQEWKEFFEKIRDDSLYYRLPIVLIIVGLELALIGLINIYNVKDVNVRIMCKIEDISSGRCPSRWVSFHRNITDEGAGIAIREKSKILNYIQPRKELPFFVLMETSEREPGMVDVPFIVSGMIHEMDPSHYLFLKKGGFQGPIEAVKVLRFNETPETIRLANRIQAIVFFGMSILGIGIYIWKKRKAKFAI